jgi:hypothetical protein
MIYIILLYYTITYSLNLITLNTIIKGNIEAKSTGGKYKITRKGKEIAEVNYFSVWINTDVSLSHEEFSDLLYVMDECKKILLSVIVGVESVKSESLHT